MVFAPRAADQLVSAACMVSALGAAAAPTTPPTALTAPHTPSHTMKKGAHKIEPPQLSPMGRHEAIAPPAPIAAPSPAPWAKPSNLISGSSVAAITATLPSLP